VEPVNDATAAATQLSNQVLGSLSSREGGKVMNRFALMLTVTTLAISHAAPSGFADIVSWHVSSGMLPSDPSIPADQRFEYQFVDSSWVDLNAESLNITDDSTTWQGKFFKNDFGTIAASSDWAYQFELRMNSHFRPNDIDVGGSFGIRDEGRDGWLLVATDKVGFLNSDGTDWFANHLLDATDFHTYRVVKSMGVLSLYVDVFDTPVLTMAYADLPGPTGPVRVDLAATSNPGIADFDIRSFAFNPTGTIVPEPSTGLLLMAGLVGVGTSRRQR